MPLGNGKCPVKCVLLPMFQKCFCGENKETKKEAELQTWNSAFFCAMKYVCREAIKFNKKFVFLCVEF